MDLTGRMIYSNHKGLAEINISDASGGIYFYQVILKWRNFSGEDC